MSDTNGQNAAPDADAKRLALEAIATLVNIKRIAADQILRPAGVPEPLIREFTKGRDQATGDALTKRQAGAMILEKLSETRADTRLSATLWIWLPNGKTSSWRQMNIRRER
ncbi:hypothetical protein PY365_24775 [Roseiarcaceae bacterium H3SJ34-1]|uniref:hypothetical protein n=1 Tax=Terripilifer ovatus TaxID=3032367 RepID=UPI003AB921CA|nr:hypothetical protein [Roseiarcaceae bacterium H3SJ34-1]